MTKRRKLTPAENDRADRLAHEYMYGQADIMGQYGRRPSDYDLHRAALKVAKTIKRLWRLQPKSSIAGGGTGGDMTANERDAMTTIDNRLRDPAGAEATKQIEAGLEWLQRILMDKEMRYYRAVEAGRAFAASVYEFMQDPEGVGTHALTKAYSAYTSQDAGNFS